MDTVIRFRVATSDKVLFENAAKLAKQSLSEWMRSKLLASVSDEVVASVTVPGGKSEGRKATPPPRMKTLTREEREARTAEFQRGMGKK